MYQFIAKIVIALGLTTTGYMVLKAHELDEGVKIIKQQINELEIAKAQYSAIKAPKITNICEDDIFEMDRKLRDMMQEVITIRPWPKEREELKKEIERLRADNLALYNRLKEKNGG